MVYNLLIALGDFAINNHIVIVVGAIVGRHLWILYQNVAAVRDVEDDWFEVVSYHKMLRKHGSRHKDFVNTTIKAGRDKSMVYPKPDGSGYTREFKE